MDDTKVCPLCSKKLITRRKTKWLFSQEEQGSFKEKSCNRMNHSVHIISNLETSKIEYIKFSLEKDYSKYLEINYHNNTSCITYFKSGKSYDIKINRVLDPDFPDLHKIKDKVNVFITFS